MRCLNAARLFLTSLTQLSFMEAVRGGFPRKSLVGPPARCPFTLFWLGGSPTKIDYREKGTLILTSQT